MSEKERSRRGRKRAPAEEATPVEEPFQAGVRDLEEGYAGLRDRVCDMFGLPEDFGVHMRAARREFWLAVRSVIDARIEDLEEADKQREVGRHSHIRID